MTTCYGAADAPYELSPEFLHLLFTKHRIDYVVHGDDPCLLPDGTDAYAYAKKLRRFKMIKRTEGVSSTDIVGRMLMCTRDNARFREVGCSPSEQTLLVAAVMCCIFRPECHHGGHSTAVYIRRPIARLRGFGSTHGAKAETAAVVVYM